MGCLLILLGLTASFWVPFVQRRLRVHDRPWSNRLAVRLVPVPGAFLAVFFIYFAATFDDPLSQISLFHTLSGGGAIAAYCVFLLFTAVNLGIWKAWELLAGRGRPPLSPYPRQLIRRYMPVLLLLAGVPAFYLGTYRTLQHAVETGNVELARKRLEFNLLGVDAKSGYIDQCSDGIHTGPLLPVAAARGDIDMARLLLEHGARVNEHNELTGITPLEEAIVQGQDKMVVFLLDRGANPDPGLSVAFGVDRRDLLKVLLDKGANPNLALSAACFQGWRDFVEALLANGANPSSGVRDAVAQGNREILLLLLDKGADPSLGLHQAVTQNNLEILQLLLDRGANVETKDEHGLTALDVAAKSGKLSASKLLRHYADQRKSETEGH